MSIVCFGKFLFLVLSQPHQYLYLLFLCFFRLITQLLVHF
ncbi:hypothetical protein ECENVIRA811_5309 [Escherichia coli Envira 8/11]|nr:hypothetical protein ECENVIRA811_5309 [Escherichia coli Envira 8/11]EMX63082.1 hypothetical protein ECENVIRA101_5279 [Escherichia coli Envira 10/1]